jgi:hypothetical protein
MEASKEIRKKFYETIGKLFFAIAASDGIVRKDEIDTLKKIIMTEWVSRDKTEDTFGTELAYQIEFSFEWLVEQDINANDCFAEFSTYKQENPTLFTPKINSLILKTANAVASAFSGKNKSELIMLNQLELVLK